MSSPESWRLHGSIVVTGATGGIGAATARRLAERGARVVICGRNDEALESLAVMLRADGHDVVAETLDMTDEGAVEALATKVAARGDFSGWVNNAGVNDRKAIVDISVEEFQKLATVNVVGYFLGIRAAGRRLAPGGAIVNVSSISAHIAMPNNAHYGSTKGAIESLTRHAAIDLAERGIRVNAVAPGSIRTNMTEARLADPAALEQRIQRIPLRRIGVPDDIAGPIAFLCSDEAAYITGTTIVVDGGWIAG